MSITFVITVHRKSSLTSKIEDISLILQYDGDCCVGEVIRNICVNAKIDPDTRDGVTHNIIVSIQTAEDAWEILSLGPLAFIRDLTQFSPNIVHLSMEEILLY